MIRLELTPKQALKLDSAKPGGAAFVLGYAQRHPWPDNGKFSLVVCFTDFETAHKAAAALNLIDAPRKRRKARSKP